MLNSKRYPNMTYDPEEWVDFHARNYGHMPSMIDEMLDAMANTMVPPKWIEEAKDRSNFIRSGGKPQ